jgi:serralysin
MATIVSYAPQGIIDKALFNFDAMGVGYSDFKLTGVVTVSISQPFMYSQYLLGYGNNLTWSPDVAAITWNATQVSNINLVLANYSSFANISFSSVINYSSSYSPLGVGLLASSDINISLIYRNDLNFSGMSSANLNLFNYTGSQLDIVLDVAQFGTTDYTLDSSTYGWHTLMHELGHSLGLSHPHSAYNTQTGVSTLTTDYIATNAVGFNKLGFVINAGADMNKEYFTIMSYDDVKPTSGMDTYAQTPMILDVIALQNAYGVGSGTSGSGNDVITPGTTGAVSAYRTYFDTGGTDTINLVNYSTGVYLHMGASIVGASHLVGVSMSMSDYQLMIGGSSPQSLRWFYGEFENATGSSGADFIIGNSLNNVIDGGAGVDTAEYTGTAASYTITIGTSTSTVVDKTANRDGTDTLTNVERLKFLVADSVTGANGVALDIGKDQTAGSGYMLYKAAFNREPDPGGLGFWISKMDGNMSYNTVAENFVYSTEFKTAFGGSNPSVNTLVTKLYSNVLNRAPDSGGFTFWQDKMTTGGWTTANVLGYFATSAENVTNVASLIANGIAYTEHVG